MKKNLLKGLAVVAFAMIAGYNVYQAHSETEGMSELMLANVEALAGNEDYGTERCPGGRHLCEWVLYVVTNYDQNGPDDI